MTDKMTDKKTMERLVAGETLKSELGFAIRLNAKGQLEHGCPTDTGLEWKPEDGFFADHVWIRGQNKSYRYDIAG